MFWDRKEWSCEVVMIGYETFFRGEFEFDRELNEETKNLINNVEEETNITDSEKPDSYPFWYTNGKELFCEEGKAYFFEEWLGIILENIIKPRGYILNGEVEWIGEDPHDRGRILITDSEVKSLLAKIEWV